MKLLYLSYQSWLGQEEDHIACEPLSIRRRRCAVLIFFSVISALTKVDLGRVHGGTQRSAADDLAGVALTRGTPTRGATSAELCAQVVETELAAHITRTMRTISIL